MNESGWPWGEILKIFAGIALSLCILWIHAYVPSRLERAEGDRAEDALTRNWTLLAVILLVALNASWMVQGWVAEGALTGDWTLREVTGVIVGIFGTLFRYWAIRTLGRFFTLEIGIRRGHELIVTGPYRWLIHPSYSGALAAIAGFCLYFGQAWPSLIYLGGLTTFYVLRIRSEEVMLRNAFGERFDARVKKVSRLLPFLY